MSHGIFGGSLPIEDNPAVHVNTRRNSSIAPISLMGRRGSRAGSIAHIQAHSLFMIQALEEARTSLTEGGIPTGCLLVRQGQVVARGHNRRVQNNSSILHAEIDCLQAAGRQSPSYYRECTLYLTHTPCSMCAGAIRFYGIPRVVIGDNKVFHGDEALLRASGINVEVLDSDECREILENYIKQNPVIWNENIGHEGH